MTKNELRRLKSRKVQVTDADLITPMEQAQRLMDSNPARITLFPDTKRFSTTNQVNDFIRSRAARLNIPVATMSAEQAADYK